MTATRRPAIVQIVRPVLGMNDAALEPVHAWPIRPVALGVVVVAAAHEQKGARVSDGSLFRADLRLDGPERIGGGPRCTCDAVVEPDAAVDPVLFSGGLEVAQDGRTISNGPIAAPRSEAEPERVHVRVGANAGEAEQVPGSPKRVPLLQDGEALGWAVGFHEAGRPDAREPSPDNEHVDLLRLRTSTLRNECSSGSVRSGVSP